MTKRSSTSPTVIDLFAGCGGMTQGFVDAGFTPVFAVESDLAAASTYAANFGEGHVRWQDIAEVDSGDVPEADVVIGGPPCQGFSNLGTRDPRDPRNRLWEEYVRILTAARPKVFIIENVDRFARSHEFLRLQEEADSGRLADYSVIWSVLNAADYGVPQRRRRAIVIGSRVGDPRLPEKSHSREPDLDGLPEWRTVRDAMGHVPQDTDTTRLPETQDEFFGETVPGVFKSADLHIGRNPTDLSLKRYDQVPPGGNRFDLNEDLLPPCWRNKPTGTTDVMGRMRWDAPSLTIRTEFFKPEKGRYLHPQHDDRERVNRPITHYEAALLQTFPEDFGWCGSKTEIAKQIGNAVPVVLAEAIARSVRELL